MYLLKAKHKFPKFWYNIPGLLKLEDIHSEVSDKFLPDGNENEVLRKGNTGWEATNKLLITNDEIRLEAPLRVSAARIYAENDMYFAIPNPGEIIFTDYDETPDKHIISINSWNRELVIEEDSFIKLEDHAGGGVQNIAVDNLGRIIVSDAGLGGGILTKKVTISSAEILQLYNPPKTLIAAPDRGKAIDLLSCILFLDFNTLAYANGGNALKLMFDTNEIGSISTAFLTGYGANTYKVYQPSYHFFNKNLALKLFEDVANPTSGNSSIDVHLLYKIITLYTLFPPLNVQATFNEVTQEMTLSWDAVPGADSYKYFCGTTTIGSPNPPGTWYYCSNPPGSPMLAVFTAGRRNWYYVTTVIGTEESIPSEFFYCDVP